MNRLLIVMGLMVSLASGQTVGEGKEEFKQQEAALTATFLEYMTHQAEIFAEKTKDTEGDLTVAYTASLGKTHRAWLAWADLQAKDQVAAEEVGKQEALFLMTKAWLYEEKIRELKSEIGGPENVILPVIDDSRINIAPTDLGFSPYLGEVGGSKGAFALQWFDDETVRGAFASHNGLKTFRVFGDNSKEGLIELLLIVQGDDAGTEVTMKKSIDRGKVVWSGFSELLGDIVMEKIKIPAESGKASGSSYEGKSGRSRLSVNLNWLPSGHVNGVWTDERSGEPCNLSGFNYAPGRVVIDRWEQKGIDVEGGAAVAVWFLTKEDTKPVTWKGTAIYLNGHEEEVSLVK